MVNFGVAYGMSDFGLADRLHIPREDAQRFIADYFAAYEGIRRYIVEMKILARDQGFVTTLLGRRRYLPELTARNSALRAAGERMAINMPIQGTAADGIKIAMVRLDEAAREPGPARHGCCCRSTTSSCSRPMSRSCRRSPPSLASVMEGALPLDVPLDGGPQGRERLGADGPPRGRRRRAWRRVPRSGAAEPELDESALLEAAG